MVTTWIQQNKSGTTLGGWLFNQINYTFNQATDPVSGDIVYFNGAGVGQTWTNQPKN